MVRRILVTALSVVTASIGGCGNVIPEAPAPLFGVPLTINGEPVGPAVIDTGGAYEVLLREHFGLRRIGQTEVLAFAGVELVDVTEGFDYTAGGWQVSSDGALVGLSVCDCNGLGFFFFRKTGAVLAIDFANLESDFVDDLPEEGISIPYAAPPLKLFGFNSAFIEIEVAIAGEPLDSDSPAAGLVAPLTNSAGPLGDPGDLGTVTLLGLLDTGASATVMRRGLLNGPVIDVPFDRDRMSVTIRHEQLGTLAAEVGLFNIEGLPDLILGTDAMRAWADQWYFKFDATGGSLTAIRGSGGEQLELQTGRDAQKAIRLTKMQDSVAAVALDE